MTKKEQIAAMKAKLVSEGLTIPSAIDGVSEDEQIAALKTILGDEEEPSREGTEFKDIGAKEIKALLGAINDLQKQVAKRDNDVDALNRKITELSSGGGFGAPGSQYNEDFIRMMREINRPERNEGGTIPMEFANDDDKCDPVTFFSTKANVKIGVIEVGGQQLSPPNNHKWVIFQNDFWFRDNFTQKLHVRGHYTTSSKLMIEYIRKSNKYRVEIFEDTNEASAMSENSYWADIRDQRLQAIKGRPEHVVVQQAISRGINIGAATEHFHICKLLAEKEADEQIASEKAGADSLRPDNLIMRARPIVA